MINFKNALIYILCALFLINCATDNTPKPRPLPVIKNSTGIIIAWAKSDLSTSNVGSFVPVIDADNAIFTADCAGNIYKYDSTDGTKIFKFNIKHKLSSGTAITSDSIFVTTLDGYLLSIGKVDHEIKWQTKLPTLSIEAPQAVNNIVVVKTVDDSILAYNAQTGNSMWIFQQPAPNLMLRATNTFQISQSGDILIAGQTGGRLSLINLLNGSTIWDIFVAIPSGATDVDRLTDINMRPVLNDDKTICVGYYNGKIACLNALTSNIIWSTKFSTVDQLIIDNNKVYAISLNGVVYAFDRYSGKIIWKNDNLKYRKLGSPVFLNNTIASVDDEGYINLFNKTDGVLMARINSSLVGGTSYPISDGVSAIMQSASGNLVKFTIKQ